MDRYFFILTTIDLFVLGFMCLLTRLSESLNKKQKRGFLLAFALIACISVLEVITIVVDGAPSELYPGMNVSATILVEDVGNVLCIPVDYVSRGNTVLVAGEGCLDEKGNVTDLSKIETREVALGRSNDEYIEILSGLEEGETVLMENQASNWITG